MRTAATIRWASLTALLVWGAHPSVASAAEPAASSQAAPSGAEQPTTTAASVPDQAPEDDTPWASRPFAVEAIGGLGTPVGLVGGALEITPTRYLSLSGGLGATEEGLQGGAWLRFRIPIGDDGFAISLGPGFSAGPYVWQEGEPFDAVTDGVEKEWERAWWFNADAGVEMRFRFGLQLRVFGGYALLTNPADGECIGDSAPLQSRCVADFQDDGGDVPYVGLAVGYAFPEMDTLWR